MTAAAAGESVAPRRAVSWRGRLKPGSPRRWWPVALAVVLLAVGAGLKSVEHGGSPATGNRALSDRESTRTALAEIPPAVAKIFSYQHTDPAATAKTAQAVLSGKAASQYTTLFGVVTTEAPRQRLTLTSTVNRAGIVSLDRGAAVVLVFLDQIAVRPGKRPAKAAAQLIVTAARQQGRWRITELRAA